ncbi:MAG: TonB-dependent receptor [Sphingomonadales bacterium]
MPHNRLAITVHSTLAVSAAALALGAMAWPAAAQSATGDEEIVITGSRIPRAELSAVSPLTVVEESQLRFSGNVNIERLLNELPQTTAAATTTSNNPGTGAATVDLRGLGEVRTLVLVNGRRHVPTSLDGFVDVNLIPTALVERVEVITGGASAVYGSDAVSGVVNFIYKDDFEGVAIDGSYDISSRGDAGIANTALTIGGNFAQGRGNAVIHAGYSRRKAVLADDRDFSAQPLGDSAFCFSFIEPSFLEPCGSSRIPSGFLDDLGATFTPDGDVNFNVMFGDPSDPGDPFPFGFNYQTGTFLQTPQERFSTVAQSHYDLTPSLRLYGEFSFIQHETRLQDAPTPADIENFHFNYADNPFLTNAAKAEFAFIDDAFGNDIAAGDGIVFLTNMRRRLSEFGNRQTDAEFNALRLVTGLKGDIATDWQFDLSINYGRSVNTSVLTNDASASRFKNGLNAGLDNQGTIRCLSQLDGNGDFNASLDPNCVPLNIWGENTLTADMVAFARAGAVTRVRYQQFIAEASVLGHVARLPAGDLTIAAGVQYRDESARGDQDSALQSGDLLGFNAQGDTSGGYDVTELFVEAVIPLLADLPAVQRLEANAAARYSDYSTVGGVWTYAGGVNWQPVADLVVHGQYQRAVRAPNVFELFGGDTQSFQSFLDPCNAGGGLTPAQEAFCIAWGVPTADIGSFSQRDNQVESLFAASTALAEEKTNTWTFGAVLAPRIAPGLRMTVDYYRITLRDAIGFLGGGAQGNIDGCFNSGDLTSAFCQNSPRNVFGQLGAITVPSANLAAAKTEGVDFEIHYSFQINTLGLGEDGATLGVTARGTHLMALKFQSEAGAGFLDCAGIYVCFNNPFSFSGSSPKWKGTTRFSYASGPLQVFFDWRYIHSMKSSDFSDFPDLEVGANTGQVIDNQKIAASHYFDIAGTYQIRPGVQVYAGVENIFDNKPPLIGDLFGVSNNTDPATFDVIGTRIYFGTTLEF